jgi:hypothetical protein
MRLLLATAAAVLLTPVPAAHAATVVFTHTDGNKYTFSGDAVALTGDGAADDVTAAIGPAGIDLSDATAPLAAAGQGSACAPVDEHRVHCAIDQGVGSLTLDGGDGADRLTIVRAPGWTATGTSVSGGAGDDVLTGSDAGELLDGGTGRDVLRGMGGDDRLRAGELQEGEVYDGGDGADELELAGVGLLVDLAAGTVGLPAGGGDTIAGVEGVTVGGGSTAFGTDGPDGLAGGGTLDGRGGDDRIASWAPDPQVLRGGEGDDDIEYGIHDDVDGGPGDDRLAAQQQEELPAHAIRCGPGDDEVIPSTSDVPGPDCERIDAPYFALRNDLRVVARGTALRFSAVLAVPQQRGCGIVAWADAPGVRRAVTAVARRRVAVRTGARVTATMSLRPSGRRLIADGRLRAPRVYLRLARRCAARGRWPLAPATGGRFGRRLAIGAATTP